MDEIDEEDNIESNVFNEIGRSSKAVASALYNTEFPMEDFAFDCRTSEAVYWKNFIGIINKEFAGRLLVVKEVFRSVGDEWGIIFMDNTLVDK